MEPNKPNLSKESPDSTRHFNIIVKWLFRGILIPVINQERSDPINNPTNKGFQPFVKNEQSDTPNTL